jgi:hypothetical protein
MKKIMIGFLVRAAVGGAVAYGALRILEKTQILEQITLKGVALFDEVSTRLVTFKDGAAVPTDTDKGSNGMGPHA